jgi:coenzyme F420 hydrogenase subunit beta
VSPITSTQTRPERERLDARIERVLASQNCSGCGACTLLDSGLQMRETVDGFLRPVRVEGGSVTADASKTFQSACPGVTVSAHEAPGAHAHPTMGAYQAVFRAWATDPEVRLRGSSGGVLTALSTWMLETGQAARVTGAAAAPDPRRSVPVTITTREQALAAAGSRYTPVAALANPDALLKDSIVLGKPCEASAMSSLGGDRPLILSFFCAGTPSALATDRLLAELEMDPSAELDELWYRGHGWPGEFTARSGSATVRADYDDSWGRVLGPSTQWRCKVCADGVGESADIVAADFWQADARGFPSFVEGDGVSALIARTVRGLDLVKRAAAAGVLVIEPIEMDSLAAVQPLQRDRRLLLAARLAGTKLAGRAVPNYRGFRLLRLSLRSPRRAITALRGAYRRVRAR